jgi:membrane associated rhomboid family serine protease
MGLYDRQYSRESEPGFHLAAPTTATMQILLFTVAMYLVQKIPSMERPFTEFFALDSHWFLRPWQLYHLLTYGFLHDPNDIAHILMNMLVFWMFGRELEQRYGRTEFVVFYLVGIVFAGLVWSLIDAGSGRSSALIGASGGISALFALYAFNYPHRQVLFMFFIPMPMWLAAAILIFFDVRHATGMSDVAGTAHLAGAAFGALYYHFHWNLSSRLTGLRSLTSLRRRPKLRVHEPEEDEEDDLSVKVDAILQKIQDHGQESLSWNERRILEKASRRYQQKRK